MMPASEVQVRVARGAAFLDVHRPGWAAEIDVGRLAVEDPCRCILGQLFPEQGFADAAVAFWPEARTDGAPIQLHGCGLAANDDWADYEERGALFALLTDAWRVEIAARV